MSIRVLLSPNAALNQLINSHKFKFKHKSISLPLLPDESHSTSIYLSFILKITS